MNKLKLFKLWECASEETFNPCRVMKYEQMEGCVTIRIHIAKHFQLIGELLKDLFEKFQSFRVEE